MKKLPDRLKELRGKVSQGQISKEFEVSQQTWGTWELGQFEPNATKIISICQRFNVSADWLLGLSDERTQDIGPGLRARHDYELDRHKQALQAASSPAQASAADSAEVAFLRATVTDLRQVIKDQAVALRHAHQERTTP